MKKILFLSILSALLVSCNSLDVSPVGALTSANFPTTDADAIALVNGAYVYASEISTYTSYMTDLPSDEEQCGEAVTSAGAPIGTYDHSPSNVIIYTAWTYLYQGVTTANDVIDQVKQAASGLLGVEIREEIIGIAQVRDVFRSSKFGAVAGCMVTEGSVKRSKPIRVLRNNTVVFQGELESLRRFKDLVDEVRNGMECGIAVKQYNDVKVGDQIECFERIEVARTL